MLGNSRCAVNWFINVLGRRCNEIPAGVRCRTKVRGIKATIPITISTEAACEA